MMTRIECKVSRQFKKPCASDRAASCRGNAGDFYSASSRFEARLEHRLF
jgi:hypothetical protein